MRTIPAQEIKRRGISAVDDLLREGPVYVIQRNRPRYVVLDEAHYRDLSEARRATFLADVRASVEEAATGCVTRYQTTEELMAAIGRHADDEA